ncbi:MAG: BACON domain-containing protein [Saprospiraceae bacterium]|nr:BACON domain-containing protein [Saprospiraceae bacterium]
MGSYNPGYNAHRWAFSNDCTAPPTTSNVCNSAGCAPLIEENPCYGPLTPAIRITISPSCSGWTATPPSANFTTSGGNSSFVVSTTVGGCAYSAISNVSWINNVSASSSTVSYHVDNNSGASRVGTISIKDANQVTQVVFTVNQDGVAGCNYSISPLNNPNVSVGGGSGFIIQVTAGINCGWAASAIEPWITINSGSSGTGNGTCTYSITANNQPGVRTGSIIIAGSIFNISQAGVSCNYSNSPPNNFNVPAPGGSGLNIALTTGSGCPWTAAESFPWITITSGNNGIGSEIVFIQLVIIQIQFNGLEVL